jgi:hypothetical protein
MNNPCKYSAKSLSEEEEEEKTERKKIKTLMNKKEALEEENILDKLIKYRRNIFHRLIYLYF